MTHSATPSESAAKRSAWRRKRVVIPAAVLGLSLVASTATVGSQGWKAADDLQVAAGLFGQLQRQIQLADLAGARVTLASLQERTDTAHDRTDGWLWSLTGHMPWIGDDVAAVSTVSKALDNLAADGLPALINVAEGLDPAKLTPKGGRVDPAVLVAAAPKIAQGLAVIRDVQKQVDGIPTEGLRPDLRSAVDQLDHGLGKAEGLVGSADRAARLLPPMLGADKPRTYLMLFQNLAEVRATGGMPGAYIVIKADKGAINIVDQGTTGTLTKFDKPVLDVDADMETLYTDKLSTYLQNVNLTPDFPTTAALARKMYAMRSGTEVDGVLSTDPVALSYLLKVTGSVSVPKSDPLTADNAVRVLLSEAYAKFPDPKDQDQYFAGAARAIFEALVKGQGDAKGVLTELSRAAGERRLLMWSANPEEEAALAGTVLEGRLPTTDGSSPTVGVFLNDGSGAKLSYYLNEESVLRVGDCDEDGSRLLHLKVTLGSTAPKSGLPAYVTGLELSGSPYTSRTNLMIFSPIGGGVVGAVSDGKEVEFGTGIERDRVVGVITVDLPPGSSKTYDVTLQTAPLPDAEADVLPRLWTTPGVRPWKSTVEPGGRCT
ncbi:DUF4012 domain-containing protein [Actinoplanes sp. NPDC049548]|uniref:DUF4012 domain-containing protein n=1 Tax=Actinoplanes sp. NPDC049548 TaxID=3155152 RepID=UPI0034459A66